MVRNGLYILIVSLILASCDSSTSSNMNTTGAGNKYLGVTRVVSYEEADANVKSKIDGKCGYNRGLAILTGDDGNANGTLEYDEALQTGEVSVLCNGENGKIVDNTSDIFQDEILKECGDGNGLAFSVAYDSDRDGKLSASEVAKDNRRIICNAQYAKFNMEYYEYYSTLEINNSHTNTKLNFYYPKIIEIPATSTKDCKGTGGFRIEMLSAEQTEKLGHPVVEINKTVCNGADGETPTITPIDSNSSNTENDKCQKTGGIKVSLSGSETFICNGERGSFDQDLNLSIHRDVNDGNSYLYNGTEKISQPLDNIIVPQDKSQLWLTEKNSSVTCPYGELNVSIYIDANLNNKLDLGETITQSQIICSAEHKSAEALTVIASMNIDTNLTINFKFNRAVNPLTVNSDTIMLKCEDEYINGDINYTKHLYEDGVQDFNFTYTKSSLPQPPTDIDCIFKVSKFVEDTDGVSMQESYTKDFLGITVK